MSPDARVDMIEKGGETILAQRGLRYLSGFGNELQSEAVPGVLPEGSFSFLITFTSPCTGTLTMS